MATNKLKEYNRKRDFSKTKEPSGKIPAKGKSKKLTFVQYHRYTRLLTHR